ncbi:MAG: diaminopimelate epimerase [Nonlabens sp.]
MVEVPFFKYQGTGNDFVIIDNRQQPFSKKDTKLFAALCDRRFGVGADGVILLENHTGADFKMVYFNSDGQESTMCGNGGRCLTAFAKQLGIITDRAVFEAVDGMHTATIAGDGLVSLQMIDVQSIQVLDNHVFTDTGSPHHVQLTDNLDHLDVVDQGRRLRYDIYGDTGSNINFVQPLGHSTFKVRTYERGVEDETLSCGTGVTAVALAMHNTQHTSATVVQIKTQGGDLQVSFEPAPQGYKNIWLTGPAQLVFTGSFLW